MSAHYFDHHPASDYQPSTLIELLRWRASRQARQEAYTFLLDGESEEARLTYEELDRRARAVGAWLQTVAANGDRVLLLYPPGLDYIAAFFGCLYAGAIAVPVYPPEPARPARTLPRLASIVRSAEPTLVVTTDRIRSTSGSLFPHAPELATLRWIAAD